MFKIRKVKAVCYSEFNDCAFITYEDTDGITKCAACTEHLSVRCNDTVEIYSDDYVHYRGYSAMALKVV